MVWWHSGRDIFVFVFVFVFDVVFVFGKIGRMVWRHPDGDINEGSGNGKKDDISEERMRKSEIQLHPDEKWILL